MRAQLRYYAKDKIAGRYVMELSIHEVGESERYPDGVKYGLFFKDLMTGKFVLLDNHYPKGPHAHIGKEEFSYEYVDDERLIGDFMALIKQEFGVEL